MYKQSINFIMLSVLFHAYLLGVDGTSLDLCRYNLCENVESLGIIKGNTCLKLNSSEGSYEGYLNHLGLCMFFFCIM